MTVKLNENTFNHELKCKEISFYHPWSLDYSGTVVGAAEPTERLGLYWGYTVRVANKFEDIFEECPYQTTAKPDEGYDLKLAISNDKSTQPADVVDFEDYKGFKHALVFFGGIEGIEGIVESDENSKVNKTAAIRKMFDQYINCLPERGTRCFRTEESILVSLSNLYPKFR